mgnify:CR=1 FL=1
MQSPLHPRQTAAGFLFCAGNISCSHLQYFFPCNIYKKWKISVIHPFFYFLFTPLSILFPMQPDIPSSRPYLHDPAVQTTSSEILSAMSVPRHLPAVDTDWHPISSAETFLPIRQLTSCAASAPTFESAVPYPDIHTRKQMLPVLLLPAGLPPVTAPAAAQTNRCHPEIIDVIDFCHESSGLRYQCPLHCQIHKSDRMLQLPFFQFHTL